MRIPLVGQAYQLRSPAVSAQSCLNLFPELIQDPNEALSAETTAYNTTSGKNKAFLYGIPGRHIFKDLTTIDSAATPIRGVYAVGGKFYVAAGTRFMQLDSNGNLVGSVQVISNAPVLGFINTPVTILANGSQIFVVSGGVGYIDSGSGLTQITIGDYNGTVTLTGFTVTWVSGDQFLADGSWIGKTIVINGVNCFVSNVPAAPTATTLYLTSAQSFASPPNYTYLLHGYTPAFVTGAYLNDSFFANQLASRTANFSNVFQGQIWNGLNLISKDTWPDLVTAVLSNGSQVFLFGTDSFDVFQANPGSSTTFFTRVNGASARVGNTSPWSPISIGGNVYFIGTGYQGGPVAYVLNGFTPTRISQHGQEAVWLANNLGPGCISYTYTEEGHSFWVINFGSQTWAYDTTTGAWHQRCAGNFGAYHTAYHSFVPEFGNGKHLTGGPLDGTIYETSVAFYDDNGTDIYWRHALPFLYNARNRMYDQRLELEMETGTAPSGTPTVTLDYSDDRGHTFGTQYTAIIGAAGAYSQRVYWAQLGSYDERIYRFTGNGQYRVALIDAELAQEAGTC